MPKYVPINDGLCIVEQEVKSKKVVTKREATNHIWIYDRSGSMTSLLPELTKQLIQLSKTLPKGDILSLGWFSSEGGEYDWVFKGFKVTDASDYKALEAAIKKNSSSIGCTCFSEILTNTDTVIEDLSTLSKSFSLHFFTDGYPVVSNYKKEHDGIFAAIKKIKGKLKAAMLVGFGTFFNKELMSEMSEKLGAILIHSSLIPEYSNSVTKLIQLSENQESKEEVESIIENPLSVFTVTDQGVVTYSLDDDNKLYVNPQKGKSTFIYYLSKEKPNKKSWDKIEVADIGFADDADKLGKALYAAILVLTQQTKTDLALEISGKIGDKSVIDNIYNAYTIEDYDKAEEGINRCLVDVEYRFSNGRDDRYLPPQNAFCVFELLNTLMNDDSAAFFPYDDRFNYERIGLATKAAEGFSKFSPDKLSKCYFNDLIWHESRLNLNVQTKVKGTVELKEIEGKSAKDFGFSNPYPSFVFRNFTFIKDGRVHTKKFFVTTSEKTYKLLKNKGLVFEDNFALNKTYGIDVSTLPAINRAIACGKTSATELCKAVYHIQELKAKTKSLKYLKGEEVGDVAETPEMFTEAQANFLRANGFAIDRDGSYNPPVEKFEGKDKYLAKTFDIKMSGLNTLPPVKKVMEKIASNKNRTPSETLLEAGINQYNAVKANVTNKAEWFETEIKKLKEEVKPLRSKIAETKFSVILGKKWFDEFASRNEKTLKVGDVEFSFELGEEEVEI